MATITLQGNPIQTIGNLPAVGSKAPNFKLTANDLSTKSLEDFAGKKVILNIFPSIDTGTCAASVRKFNQEVTNLENTVVLCISRDLPFAQSRFCGAEGLENVITLSNYATGNFGKDYGLMIVDPPLLNLNSRAIVILSESGEVTYTEQVAEVTEEPNYENALNAI